MIRIPFRVASEPRLPPANSLATTTLHHHIPAIVLRHPLELELSGNVVF